MQMYRDADVDPELSQKGRHSIMKQKTVKRASLSISQETKAMLDSVRHAGQSYNGLLQELVIAWKKQQGREAKGGS